MTVGSGVFPKGEPIAIDGSSRAEPSRWETQKLVWREPDPDAPEATAEPDPVPESPRPRSILAAMLTPAAAVALALAVWKIAANFHQAGNFAIGSGPFALWQTWLGMAAVLELTAYLLNRPGRGGGSSSV
jgi:hypothetical protein